MKALIIAAICCLGHPFAYSQSLTLDQYLDIVKKNNHGLSAIEIKQMALKKIEAEAQLLYSMKLESSINYTDDQRPSTSSTIQGNQTKTKTGKLGISKSNSYGTKFSISYNVAQTQINGASPDLVPQNKFYENYTKADFSQSLIRNSLGSEIKARENLIINNANSNRLNQEYRLKILLVDAENLYYQLLIATESSYIQEESLKRAKSIEQYTRKRLNQKLADKTDHLQASSALKQRELDFQIANDERRKIIQLFNSYQGINSTILVTNPNLSELNRINSIKSERKESQRSDTIAAKFNLESIKAQQKINIESLKPDLNLFGSVSLYGRRDDLDNAISDSFKSNNPVYTLGISFTMPLDFSSNKESKSSYMLSVNAAEKEYQRTVFDEENEWNNLKNSYKELNQQLRTLSELESIQKLKLDNEIKQQKRGRTTTFQVLSFEQEYLSTQLRKIQLKSNLAKIYTQLKLFN